MKTLLGVAALACSLLGCSAPPAPRPVAVAVTSATVPTTLTVVAHQDDDLLFINPDVSADIAAGRRMVTVFATAGDAGEGRAYWLGREAGARAAYAAMAGVRDRWVIRRVLLAGRSVTRATLVGRLITLIFLRLPDGHGYAVHHWQTMYKLWNGTMPQIKAIDVDTRYTRDALLTLLGTVMADYRPDMIRTLDHRGRIGDGDHADHHTAAFFTDAAQQTYTTPHTFIGYLGYPAESLRLNLTPLAVKRKTKFFLAYAQHDPHVCNTVAACAANASYTARLSRGTGPGQK